MKGQGSGRGHVVPGLFFLLAGLHWAFSVIAAFLRTLGASNAASASAPLLGPVAHSDAPAGVRKGDGGSSIDSRAPFRSRAWYPGLFGQYQSQQEQVRLGAMRPYVAMAEPLCKVFLPALGILLELFLHPGSIHWRALTDSQGNVQAEYMNVWQHSTMYLAFLLSGVVDILATTVLPSNTGDAALSLAFAIEGLLFWFHLHDGREAVAMTLHQLLVFCILGCAVCTAISAAMPSSFLLALGRPYFAIMQGLWFIAIADIEYGNPSETFWPWGLRKHWDMDAMENNMFLPVLFSWYLVAAVVILLGIYLVMHRHVQRSAQASLPVLP